MRAGASPLVLGREKSRELLDVRPANRKARSTAAKQEPEGFREEATPIHRREGAVVDPHVVSADRRAAELH